MSGPSKVTEAYERCKVARAALCELEARCMEATEDKAGILWERWLLPTGRSVILFATPDWWEIFKAVSESRRVDDTLEQLGGLACTPITEEVGS